MDFAPAESFAADAFAGVPRVIAIASVAVCRERPCHALGGVRVARNIARFNHRGDKPTSNNGIAVFADRAISPFPAEIRSARREPTLRFLFVRVGLSSRHISGARARARREGSKRDRPGGPSGSAMQSGLRHRYRRLEDDSDAPSQGSDPRFAVPDHLDPRKKPPKKRQVVLAFGLLFVGSALLSTYALYATGHLVIPKNEERGTSLAILILGCMTFAPGAYVSLIITLVKLGVPGVDYSMVP